MLLTLFVYNFDLDAITISSKTYELLVFTDRTTDVPKYLSCLKDKAVELLYLTFRTNFEIQGISARLHSKLHMNNILIC